MVRESHQNRLHDPEELTQEEAPYLTFSSLLECINAFDIATTSCARMIDRSSLVYAADAAATVAAYGRHCLFLCESA
jgi:hypothetical protein